MGVGDALLLAEATFLVFGVVFSFFVLIPMGYNYSEFQVCLLYARRGYTEHGTEIPSFQNFTWGPPSLCNFNIGLSAIVLIWSLAILIMTSAHLIRGSDWSWLFAFVTMSVHAVLFVIIFVTAMTVQIGFKLWCAAITDPGELCRDVEIWLNHKRDSSDSYVLFTVALFGWWSLSLSYLILVIISACRICVYHRRESIKVSMRRERMKLLQSWRRYPDYQLVL